MKKILKKWNFKYTLILVFFFLSLTIIVVSINSSFLKKSALKDSTWIWSDEKLISPGSSIYFRKSFKSDFKSNKAYIIITCDHEYILYLNGKRIASGGYDESWHHPDLFNISPFVNKGMNLIAIEARSPSKKGELIVKLSIDGRKITTNKSWKWIQKYSEKWKDSDFDDSSWLNPKELGKPPVKPWKKLKPPVKKLTFQELFQKKVHPAKIYIISNNDIIKNSERALYNFEEISRGDILLDFGQEVVGYLDAKIHHSKNTKLKLTYGESTKEAMDKDSPQIDHVEFILPKTEWSGAQRRAFRFVRVSGEDGKDLRNIKEIYINLVHFPVKEKGEFSSSDESLNKIWESSKRTVKLCMQSFFEDGIKRDRALWIGDLRIGALSNYYTFGNYEYVKKSLELLKNHKNKNGSIRPVYPWTGKWVLYDYLCWWVIAMEDYYLFSGDIKFIKDNIKEIESQVNFLVKRINKNGLLEVRIENKAPITDWASMPSRTGEVAFQNALFYKALISLINLKKFVRSEYNLSKYKKLAENIKENFNRTFWNSEKKAIIDYQKEGRFSSLSAQDGNVLAVLFNILDDEKKSNCLNFLYTHHSTPYGNLIYEKDYTEKNKDFLSMRLGGNEISPFMNAYEAEALFQSNNQEKAIELIKKCWGSIINKGFNTFWEFLPPSGNIPDKYRSLCHLWSTGPSYIIPSYILGIRPIEPGFKKIIINPEFFIFTELKGVIPSPLGDVKINFLRENQFYSLQLHIPERAEVVVLIPLKDKKQKTLMKKELKIWRFNKEYSPGITEKNEFIEIILEKDGEYFLKFKY